MKPNFAEMSTKELRAYVLAYREDTEALEILFSRRTPTQKQLYIRRCLLKMVNL